MKVRYESVNEILTIKEYWNLIPQEPVLVITWEPDFFPGMQFSQNFKGQERFTPIPDKANDLIFLKSPKNLVFLALFDILFFKRILLCYI